VRRLVVDASSLLAGVIGRSEGTPALLLAALVEPSFEAVICPHLLDEVSRGLGSGHFSDRLREGQAEDIVAAISESSVHFPDPAEPEPVLRDSRDDYLVALANTSKAEAIVTGDRDLLDHEGLEPPAITTRAACELLGLIESTETR
jgi:putative PIN family toxin of toxin-antitoxin system